MFCSFNVGGGGRAGAKYITTNANTNKNTGAKVTINGRAPEVPSDGSGDGRGYAYGSWGYGYGSWAIWNRSGGEPKAPKGRAEIQGKRTGGKGKC